MTDSSEAGAPRDQEGPEVLPVNPAVPVEVRPYVDFVPEQQELAEVGAAHQAVTVEVSGACRIAFVRPSIEIRVGRTALQDVARIEALIRVAVEERWIAVAPTANEPFRREAEAAQ